MGHAEDLESYAAAMREARANWPEGPWSDEPDRIEWHFDGFPCLMVRSVITGVWCGYVGVAPGHPLHGKHHDEIDVDLPVAINYAQGCSGPICHVPEPGASDAVHWIGFDCGHAFDLYPALAGFGSFAEHGRYRNQNEVRHLVTALALELKVMQLAAAGS